MPQVTVIGMGMAFGDLTGRHLAIIRRADILVGGKRHLSLFGDLPVEKMAITGDLAGLIDAIRSRMAEASVVVLASGDPLYHGIGDRLVRELGRDHVRVLPNITSVAAAFSRLGEPWQDARVVSLHGRTDMGELLRAVSAADRVAVFTDPKQHPGWVAAQLLAAGVDDVRMCVLERMGTESETIRWFDLDQAAEASFSDPNMAVLRRQGERSGGKRNPFLGMPDDGFDHQRGLITKSEVRAVTLSKLRLHRPDLILWDLGAGSGSVSVEAGALLPAGRIFAVEKEGDRITQIKANRDRHGIRNLSVVHATLPEGVDALPSPHRVFIGGGGTRLAAVIRAADGRMEEGGVMVVNTVLLGNLETARQTLAELGYDPEVVQIQVSIGKSMPWSLRLEARNPVWIISGRKAIKL